LNILTKHQKKSIGYVAQKLVIATFPHSKTKELNFTRKNGNYRLSLQALPEFGLPYGSIPRLLLVWIVTEAVKKKSREVLLGDNLSQFLKALKINRSGERIRQVKDQISRLLTTKITYIYINENNRLSFENINTVSKADIFWNVSGSIKGKSSVTLSQEFFDSIIKNPVPISVNAIYEIRKSPMAIDIYCWLTYRMSYLSRKTKILWSQLEQQFGSSYINSREFKRKFNKQILKVLKIYPSAMVQKVEDGIILYPSKTHVCKNGVDN
jgi:hypothetical protein